MKLLNLSFTAKPRKVEQPNIRLVVVEGGACGFESRVPPDASEETIVIAQTEGEAPASLALRVASRIASVERSRRRIGRAVLLVAERRDAHVSRSRRLMTHACLSHMHQNGDGELIVDADRAEAEVRDDLLSLVEGLLEEFEQGSVPIRLQFRRAPPRAGRPNGIYAVPSSADTRDAARARSNSS
jgi:hypothetical protein